MAATFVCQWCKLTTVQQRWQWQHCNITVRTSVTAATTESAVTAMAATLVCQRCKLTTVQQRWQWQRYNITVHTSVTAVTTESAVTAIFTLAWQRCAHHCEGSGNWQRCRSTGSCHCCHTNVHIVISALSLPLLSQRCGRFHCYSAVHIVVWPLWDSSCVVTTLNNRLDWPSRLINVMLILQSRRLNVIIPGV